MKRRTKWIISILGIILILPILSFCFVDIAYSIMGFNQHVDYANIKQAEDYGINSEEINVMTSDKLKITAYEVTLENPKGIVIILTGIQNPSVTYFYGQSKMLYDNGWASILVDNRGHGKSDGDKITFATQDVRDVTAIVEYINNNYNDIPIIVMGVSMGGAVAINSVSTIDDIDGLISMSAYSSWSDAAIETIVGNGKIRNIAGVLEPIIMFHGIIKYGPDFFKYIPEKTIKKIGNKPVLFIHSKYDGEVLIDNLDRLLKNYSGNADVWVRDSGNHFIVKDNRIDDPYSDTEYVNKIINFLKENFE